VVERDGQADPVVGRVSQSLADEEAVVDDVVVRERRPFRRAGRARRVLDVDRLIEVELGLAGAQIADRNPVPALEEAVPALAEDDPLAQRRRVDHVKELEVVGVLVALRRDEHRAA
jgi:hypothetical protein